MLDILCATFLESISFACLSCGQECRSARDSSGCFQSCCSPCTSCCGTMNSQEGRLRLEEDGQHVSENDDTITTQQPRWSAQETLRNWK